MSTIYKRIGQILIQLNVITHGHVLEARRVQMANPHKRIGEIMIELGHITKNDLEKALSLQRSMSAALEG
jgi:hypothetical protein